MLSSDPKLDSKPKDEQPSKYQKLYHLNKNYEP